MQVSVSVSAHCAHLSTCLCRLHSLTGLGFPAYYKVSKPEWCARATALNLWGATLSGIQWPFHRGHLRSSEK